MNSGMRLKRYVVAVAVAALLLSAMPLSPLAETPSPGAPPSRESTLPALLPHVGRAVRDFPGHTLEIDNSRVETLSASVIGPMGPAIESARRSRGRATDINLTGSDVLLVDDDLSVQNIRLSGNAVLFVYNSSRNVNLTMAGQLELRDNSVLVINHSRLIVAQLYDQQYSMMMYNTSHFYAFFSNVTTSGFQWPGALWDSSNLTVAGSEFCVNPSWFPVTLIQNASLYIAYSLFYSDIVHFDFDWVPLTSRIVLDHSAYFNIWLAVKTGASANLTLPASFSPSPLNWSFPGPFPVTNISYRVELNVSYPLLFATMQYRKSSLVVHDSPSFLGAFYIDGTAASFSDMDEARYTDTNFPNQDFSLRLVNSTIYTWNFYLGDGGIAFIDSSDVGEILTMGTGQATLRNCNLNGKGGYVSCHDNSRLMISDCVISPVIVSYQNTVMEIQNSTIDFWWPTRVLASGNSVIRLVDNVIGKNVTLDAIDGGYLENWYRLNVSVQKDGNIASNATVRATYRPGGTLAETAVTGSDGRAHLLLSERTIRPGNVNFTNNYTITAFRNVSIASLDYTLKARENLTLELLDFVSGTNPADGETNVQRDSYITINFSYVMDPVSPPLYVLINPLVNVTWWYDQSSRSLTLRPESALAPVTRYTVTLNTDARTAGGIQLPQEYRFNFTTSARPPGSPNGITATPGANTVLLRWGAPLENGGSPARGYRLYRGAGTSNVTFFTDVNATEYNDGNLTAGAMYYYAVSAVNSAGEGNLSKTVLAIPGTPPSYPRGLNATSGDGTVTLQWQAPADNGGFWVTNYTIYRGNSPVNVSLAVRLADVMNFTDTGLTNGFTYFYRISASNSRGEGPLSADVKATPKTPYTTPGKPQNIQGQSSDRQVLLTWSPPVLGGGLVVTGYRIYRSLTGTDFCFIKSSTLNSTTDNNLKNGQPYHYQVAAVNDMGEGPFSDTAYAVPWSVPSVPQNISLKLIDGKVRLKWDAPADNGGYAVSAYRIYRGPNPQELTLLVTVNTPSYIDGNVDSGKKYYYQVSAISDKGAGPSTPVNRITLSGASPGGQGAVVQGALLAVIVIFTVLGYVFFLRYGRKRTPK